MANYTTAFFDSTISDDTPFETWQEAGQTTAPHGPTSAGRPRWPSTSRRRWTRAVDESIRDFIDRKKAAMTDQWY
jgi:trimethylamine--corrinoid protein Co-methyltransferase